MDSRSVDRVDVVLEHAGGRCEVGVLHRDGGRLALDLAPAFGTRGIQIGPDVGMFRGRQYPAQGRVNFGCFSDSSPDRWGRMLMQRHDAHTQQRGRPLTEWDYLLRVQDLGRQGAIRFLHPDTGIGVDDHVRAFPPVVTLRELEYASLKLEDAVRDDDVQAVSQWLSILLAPGSSLGGARPKANVMDPAGGLMIAKFPRRDDTIDTGLWEHIYARMGEAAGTQPVRSEVRRFQSRHHTFVCPRFDRGAGGQRFHYLSAMTLCEKVDGDEASYLDILEALQSYGAPETVEADRAVLFRRMLFNVAAGNRDDHLRNHGFLVTPKGVRLAPAFDVNPAPDKPMHAITIDGRGANSDVSAAMRTAPYYDLDNAHVERIFEEVRGVLSQWSTFAKNAGASRLDMDLVETCIAPDVRSVLRPASDPLAPQDIGGPRFG